MRHKLSFASLRLWAASAALLGASACAPKLGDGCKSGLDCSVRGDRICDRSQPGGYCTISNCKPGDCGDDGVCVRFRPDEPRLSANYCMAKCGNTGDCDRDAYVCRSAKALNDESQEKGEDAIAEVLDGDGDAKFCIAKE